MVKHVAECTIFFKHSFTFVQYNLFKCVLHDAYRMLQQSTNICFDYSQSTGPKE